jgi:phage-related minor tail protein
MPINVTVNAKLGNTSQLEREVQNSINRINKSSSQLGAGGKNIGKLSQPLGRITGQADEFTKSMNAANARVIAFGASVSILNSMSDAFRVIVSTAIEVEKSLATINTLLKVSSSEIDKFGASLYDMAKNAESSFKSAADVALEFSRQGLGDSEEVIKRTNDALILMRLSGLDAKTSVDGLTAAYNSFNQEGLDTSKILNKLVNTASSFYVSEKDLIQGMQRSASVAKAAGVSFDELA